ncbi:MAG: glycosyltransferase family 4 protein, partial [Anaerolineales bacterium]
CRRDVRLAGQWGFAAGRPHVMLPTNGGISLALFRPPTGGAEDPPLPPVLRDLAMGTRAETAVNPRGFRGYVRNDTFFRAVARLAPDRPALRFLCPAMAGEREAERWRERLGIEQNVVLLPRLGPQEMAAVFRLAGISVSVSEHDGTPNSLLEAMACGAFPVCGNLESIRDWIEDGVNGLLVDAGDPVGLARAIGRALDDHGLRQRAAERNQELVTKRAERGMVFKEAEAFYRGLVER